MNLTASRILAAQVGRDPSIAGAVLAALSAALRGDNKPDGFEYILRHYDEAGALVEETAPRHFATRLGLIFGRSRWPSHRFEELRRPVGTSEQFAAFA